MKRISALRTAAALVLAAFFGISCVKEMAEDTPVTVIGTITDNASTKVDFVEGTGVIKSEWQVNDTIIGWNHQGAPLALRIDGADRIDTDGTAIFTVLSGSLPTQQGDKIYMIYAPGKKTADLTSSGLTYDLSIQEGRVPALMTAIGTLTDGQIKLNFAGRLALVAVKSPTFLWGGGGASQVFSGLKLSGDNLRSKVTVSKNNLGLTFSGSGPITLNKTFMASNIDGSKLKANGLMAYFAVAPNSTPANLTFSSFPIFCEIIKTNASFAEGKCYLFGDKSFDRHKYTITCASASNGTFTTSPSGTCAWGETVTVTATPASGYMVDKMTYTDENNQEKEITFNPTTGKGTFIMPEANTTVKVTFDFAPIDLSNPQPANCYIVTGIGKYKFRTFKGNSSTSVGTPNKVEVLWESFGTSAAPSKGALVHDVYYSDGYVHFTATDKKGNAVIAVKSGSTILWSWHIWLTDLPADQEYKNGAGTMIDRNLGATSAAKGNLGALGLLYQWGRKDPFLGANGNLSSTQAASTLSDWPTTPGTKTVDYSVQNPTTFIKIASSEEDWTNDANKDRLWDSGTTGSRKTMYDPCPPGYRVPDGGSSGVWSAAFARGSSWTTQDNWDSYNHGMNFGKTDKTLGSADPIWYPATGYSYDGVLYNTGKIGRYWSCTPDGTYAHDLQLSDWGFVSPASYNSRAVGQAVRCLKDGTVVEYTISPGSQTNGSFFTNPSGSLRAGVTVTVTATPASGYEVDKMTYTPDGGSAQSITFDPTTNTGTFIMPEKNVTVNVTFESYTGTIDGHDYVKIGNTRWATCNVGATSPTDYGYYFSWGNVTGYTYTGSNWVKAGTTTVLSGGFSENNYNGSPGGGLSTDIPESDSYDAARANWSGNWRMPTKEEFLSLCENCGLSTTGVRVGGSTSTTEKGIWRCIDYNESGKDGILFCDGAGRKVFFPAAGKGEDDLDFEKEAGRYWSRSFDDVFREGHSMDFSIILNVRYVHPEDSNDRYYGFNVRPVVNQ